MNLFDRRSLIAFGALLAIFPDEGTAAARSAVILFVCQAGTAKSAMARELLRRRAAERGISVVAVSRGLQIDDHVSPKLRQSLVAEGIDTRRDGFSVLTARDVRAADIVVTFTQLPAALRPRDLRDWAAVVSVNDSYLAARADLDRRIDALLDDVAAVGIRR